MKHACRQKYLHVCLHFWASFGDANMLSCVCVTDESIQVFLRQLCWCFVLLANVAVCVTGERSRVYVWWCWYGYLCVCDRWKSPGVLDTILLMFCNANMCTCMCDRWKCWGCMYMTSLLFDDVNIGTCLCDRWKGQGMWQPCWCLMMLICIPACVTGESPGVLDATLLMFDDANMCTCMCDRWRCRGCMYVTRPLCRPTHCCCLVATSRFSICRNCWWWTTGSSTRYTN